MALVGQVGEYVDGKKDIASYIERVELYVAANYHGSRRITKLLRL